MAPTKYFVFFLLFLLVLPIAFSKQTLSQITSPGIGIVIEYPTLQTIHIGSGYEFEFHLFNSSSGCAIIDVTNCTMHLYNPHGERIFLCNYSTFTHMYDIEVELNSDNFTEMGVYSYLFQCHITIENAQGDPESCIGGFASNAFSVGIQEGNTYPDGSGSTSVVIFVLAINLLLFFVPLLNKVFVEHEIINLFIRRAMIAIGFYMFALNTVLVASIATTLNLPVTHELLNIYLWLFGVFGYIMIVVTVLGTFLQGIMMFMANKKSERMGE